MSEFKEFLLTVRFDGMFPRLFFNKFVHTGTFELKEEQLHVIEYAALDQANAKIKELEAKLSIAVEALEFYADDINWNETDPGFSDRIDSTDYNKPHSKYIGYVGGMKARQALEKLRGEK